MALTTRAMFASLAPEKGALAADDDWPDLWSQLVAVRSASLAPREPSPLLRHCRHSGWTLDGKCSERSAALFDLYKPLLDARQARQHKSGGRPWLVAQLGQSLDGFVATCTGDSYYVTGPESLVHLHRLRALCDAVLVGAGTVAIDNPQLTTRRVPGPNAVRVVLDPAVRLDGSARVFADGQARTVWLCDERHTQRAVELLQAQEGGGASPKAPVEVVGVPGLLDAQGQPGADQPRRVVEALSGLGLNIVFVEGGGVTVSRFFRARALHRLHLVVAPVLIGEGRRGLQADAQPVMADCQRPPARKLVLGDDLLWDLDLSV